jgi:hypothetical protein
MTLFLRDEDVDQVVSMDQMLEAIESMQRHFGQGEAYNLSRRKIIASGGLLAVMGGGLFYDMQRPWASSGPGIKPQRSWRPSAKCATSRR